MKRLTRTLIVLSVFCLATTSSAMLQDPEGKIRTFTISGNAGVVGVTMKGLPGNSVTDERGYYSATVESGWTGTVTPTKEGYSFGPPGMPYSQVTSNQENQNYVPEIITYTISGQIGIPGVEMIGLPGRPVTDENGLYSTTVDYGWAGTVSPRKAGYRFNPPSKIYKKVMANQNNQDYTPKLLSQVDWQFERGRWEPTRAGVGVRSSRQTRRSAGYRPTIASTAGRKVLVVPAAEVKAQDLAEIMEDMQIMSHILDERFKETRRIQGVFTDFGDFFGRDNRQTEATYLQGYGVLFSMEVNFAFSPSPKPQVQVTEQDAEPVDSTWQRAKQQVFSPGDSRGTRGSDPTDEYDSQMVEELKRDLITTLKHAANIRGVQPDEWIILTVIGGGRQAGGFGGGGFMMGGMYGGASSDSTGGFGGGYGGAGGSSGYGSGGMGDGMMGGMGGGMGGFSEMSVSAATVLTIRSKKSDIDAFAKGEQDFEQFRRKVQIFTY